MALIALLFSMVIFGVALQANARFRRSDRLPMQWWLNGEVTWSAPRRVALAFIPALALSVYASMLVLALYVPIRPGQESMALPTFVGMGVMFLAIQRLHLWLVALTLRRGGS